jgi:hypothetical protein
MSRWPCAPPRHERRSRATAQGQVLPQAEPEAEAAAIPLGLKKQPPGHWHCEQGPDFAPKKKGETPFGREAPELCQTATFVHSDAG